MATLQIISQEMSNDSLVIRQHLDDLTTKSQVMVYESQEAIFVKNGQALDVFGPGRHELETANVPLLKKFFAGIFGGKTPFPCDVYFINKVNVLDFIWGTDSPIDLSDPKYPMLVSVRANGQTAFRIADSRRFVVKVVGMLKEYTAETLKKTVKGLIMAPVKECIAQTITEKQVSILEVTSRLTDISATIEEKLNARIADYGIRLEHFNVNAIKASDGDYDALRRQKEEMSAAQSEAYKMTLLSEARAKARALEGYTYQEERRFDVLEGAAKNESAGGGFVNMGVGLGVGVGVGREVGKITGTMVENAAAPAGQPQGAEAPCPACGAAIPAGAKFCMNCGQARPVARFCPECGTKAADGAKFCMNCGTKLG